MWEYKHTPESDELMHYGILGMKWGVRRLKSELASANRERKASRKAEKYLYKAEKLKAKKAESGIDRRVKKLTAKGKHAAERERIDQEYTSDVQKAKSTQMGKTFVTNVLAGAAGGALVGAASTRSKAMSGKQQAATIVTAAGIGAGLGAYQTVKTYRKSDDM